MTYKIVEFDDTFPFHFDITQDEFHNWLDKQKWKYSSSYAKKGLPHSYILEKNYRKYKQNYLDAIAFLLKNGNRERFFRVEFIYYYYGDYKYFVASTKESRYGVLNKAPIRK